MRKQDFRAFWRGSAAPGAADEVAVRRADCCALPAFFQRSPDVIGCIGNIFPDGFPCGALEGHCDEAVGKGWKRNFDVIVASAVEGEGACVEGVEYDVLARGEGADLFVAAFDLDVGGEGRGVAGDENRDVR